MEKRINNHHLLGETFERIYADYFHQMYLYARKLLKSDHLAEDVVEDVFYNLWKSQSDLSKIREIETYLLVSVKNQVIRTISRDPRKFESLDVNDEIRQIEKTNPEDILLEKELLSLIEQEIAKMSDQCQIIFKMVRLEHKGYMEVAQEMGVSVDSVKSQIYKVTSRIRECISNHNRSASDTNYYEGLLSLFILFILL